VFGAANGRRFLMAGVGFDAHVVNHVGVPMKRWLGKGAYLASTLHQLLVFGFPSYEVQTDDRTWRAASVNSQGSPARRLIVPINFVINRSVTFAT